MHIVNLTPHALTIHGIHAIDTEEARAGLLAEGQKVSVEPEKGLLTLACPPSGQVARVATSDTSAEEVHVEGAGLVPVVSTTYGEVTGLPEATPGTVYVVSGVVAGAAPRTDVFSPGPLLRAPDGHVVGCRGLRASAPSTGGEGLKDALASLESMAEDTWEHATALRDGGEEEAAASAFDRAELWAKAASALRKALR